MGFWDSVKDVALKAKCGLGFHDGKMAPTPGKPACHLSMTCADCHKLIETKQHSFPRQWSDADFDWTSNVGCMRIQRCTLCEEQLSQVEHEGYYTAGKNASCREVKKCPRCGHEKLGDEDHSWYRMSGNQDGSVNVRCGGCGKEERRPYW